MRFTIKYDADFDNYYHNFNGEPMGMGDVCGVLNRQADRLIELSEINRVNEALCISLQKKVAELENEIENWRNLSWS